MAGELADCASLFSPHSCYLGGSIGHSQWTVFPCPLWAEAGNTGLLMGSSGLKEGSAVVRK